jgi:ATP-dependent Clp protease ATP-binding subunit ClpA
MTRFDAVQYISHGIAKRAGHVRALAQCVVPTTKRARKVRRRRAAMRSNYCVNLNKKAREGKIDPLIGREAEVSAHDPGSVPPFEEQPAARRRSGRRQDRDRRRPCAQDRQGRRARSSARRDHLLARHGRAAGRHALSRRFRRAAESRDEGDRELPRRDPVHRRDPHGDRCRRHLGRGDGCLQPAEAGASGGSLRCIGSTTYKEYRQHFEKDRALVRRFQKIDVKEPSVEDADRDPQRAEALFRGLPQDPLHQRCHHGGGGAVGEIHQRPQSCRTRRST